MTIAVRAEKPSRADHDTTQSRESSIRRSASDSGGKAAILMYHRVTDSSSDPWSLCVSPERFEQQLDVLRRHMTIMPLGDVSTALARGTLPRRAVAVTFDDGYADNLITAKPLLERFDVAATVFVTSGYLGGRREFWWDELERLILTPGVLPRYLELTIGSRMHHWDLGDVAAYGEADFRRNWSWKAPDNPPTKRHAVFASLWRTLQRLPEREQQHLLDSLRDWAGVTREPRPTHRTLSAEELIALKQGQLVDIGAHSATHPVLAIIVCRAAAGAPPEQEDAREHPRGAGHQLCVPYRACEPEIIPTVRDAGFVSACGTRAGMVRRGADVFQLPRLEVQNWDGDEFRQRLRRCFP